MKCIPVLLFMTLLSCNSAFAQTTTTQQNAKQVKDAPVNVTVTDFKNNPLSHEIVVFKSQISQQEYQGMSQDDGKFSLRLPAGDKYEIYILGFKDSTSYNVLNIPALGPNASYKKPFTVDLQFQPAKSFVLEGVNFETGKANLTPDSYAVLDQLVIYIQKYSEDHIEIGGHTDNVGKPAANMLLSMERAKSVMAYLISKGVDTSKITARGYGATVPVESNKTAEGRATNRRTEVKFLD